MSTADSRMTEELLRYLQQGRDALLRALDGLDYDVRRPPTPSSTSLLGLVKHLAGVELGYLGDSVRIQAAADAHRGIERPGAGS